MPSQFEEKNSWKSILISVLTDLETNFRCHLMYIKDEARRAAGSSPNKPKTKIMNQTFYSRYITL